MTPKVKESKFFVDPREDDKVLENEKKLKYEDRSKQIINDRICSQEEVGVIFSVKELEFIVHRQL